MMQRGDASRLSVTFVSVCLSVYPVCLSVSLSCGLPAGYFRSHAFRSACTALAQKWWSKMVVVAVVVVAAAAVVVAP